MEIDNDFKWYIDTATYTDHPCPNNYCKNFGICNCLTIRDTKIRSIHFNRVVESISTQVLHPDSVVYSLDEKINKVVYGFDRDFDYYCIERICSSMKLFLPENWVVNITDGYYGQVIESVSIKEPLFTRLVETLEELFNQKTIKERSTFLLNEEYGFVSQSLIDKRWRISTIFVDDLVFPSIEHFKKITVQHKDQIESRKSKIQGVCKKNGNLYEVIDGHHRLKVNTENKVKIIEIY